MWALREEDSPFNPGLRGIADVDYGKDALSWRRRPGSKDPDALALHCQAAYPSWILKAEFNPADLAR